jgi:hypothetical protein
MWFAIRAGRVFKLAAACMLLGFVAGVLVGLHVDATPPAPAQPAPLSAAAPMSPRTSGEEVPTWSRTVSRSRFSA